MSLDEIIKTAKTIVQSAKGLAYGVPIIALASCTYYIRDSVPKALTPTTPQQSAESTVSSEDYNLQLSIGAAPNPTPPIPDYASMAPEKALALYLANKAKAIPEDDKITYNGIFFVDDVYIIVTYSTTTKETAEIPEGSKLKLALYRLDNQDHSETYVDANVDGMHPCESDIMQIEESSDYAIQGTVNGITFTEQAVKTRITSIPLLLLRKDVFYQISQATHNIIIRIVGQLGVPYLQNNAPEIDSGETPDLDRTKLPDENGTVPLAPVRR